MLLVDEPRLCTHGIQVVKATLIVKGEGVGRRGRCRGLRVTGSVSLPLQLGGFTKIPSDQSSTRGPVTVMGE